MVYNIDTNIKSFCLNENAVKTLLYLSWYYIIPNQSLFALSLFMLKTSFFKIFLIIIYFFTTFTFFFYIECNESKEWIKTSQAYL